MHELAVTESILNIANEHAKKADATRVTDIYLRIGRLSSIVDDSIQFYWDMIAIDTLSEGAKLHFERYDAKIKCLDCGTEYNINSELSPCPICNSVRIKIITGDEFRVESIEIIKMDE
jgi:hydrogenase nickel incorporation protein HypA/HybF